MTAPFEPDIWNYCPPLFPSQIISTLLSSYRKFIAKFIILTKGCMYVDYVKLDVAIPWTSIIRVNILSL